MSQEMTSSRPYMIRAIYDWIVDNQCTPFLMVNALAEGVDVPQQYVEDGQIILNISPTAVINLLVDQEAVSFNGRFGGVARDIYVPITAVMGVYARENGQGMIFELEEDADPDPGGSPTDGAPPPRGQRPALKVVK